MLGHRPPSLVLFLLLLAEASLQDNRHVPMMRKSFSVVLELSFPNARVTVMFPEHLKCAVLSVGASLTDFCDPTYSWSWHLDAVFHFQVTFLGSPLSPDRPSDISYPGQPGVAWGESALHSWVVTGLTAAWPQLLP